VAGAPPANIAASAQQKTAVAAIATSAKPRSLFAMARLCRYGNPGDGLAGTRLAWNQVTTFLDIR
jgi:hypothetical protein